MRVLVNFAQNMLQKVSMAVAAAVELPLREGLFICKNQTPDIFCAQWQAQLYKIGGAGLNICLCRTSKCQLFLRPHQQSMLHIWAWSPSFLKSWRYEKRLNNFGLQHRHFQKSVLEMKKEERRHLGQPATFANEVRQFHVGAFYILAMGNTGRIFKRQSFTSFQGSQS